MSPPLEYRLFSGFLASGDETLAALAWLDWRNFFPFVMLCQFLVLAGNRFWFYILMYLEYNTVVVLC
jgi:hypothetical protein